MTLHIEQSVTPHAEGWWVWAVWLAGPPEILAEVEAVEYILHPTFPDPVRKVTDRVSNFRLEAQGWGEFQLKARVHIDDADDILLAHWIELDDIAPTKGIESYTYRSRLPRKTIDRPLLFVSSAVADMNFTYELKDALEDEGLEVLMGQDLDDDQPIETLLATERRSIQAGLFVVSEIFNPSQDREFWAFYKYEISSVVVEIGENRELPDKMEDLPRFQVNDISETENVAVNIAQQIRDNL
jgi:hypothetical protein